MKRGFLNTDKAKRKLVVNINVSGGHSEAKAETPAPYPPPLDLHAVPPTVKYLMKHPKGKNRSIFRPWPRDPNGKSFASSDIHGKEAGNGLDLWGATLYDFYLVRRTPGSVDDLVFSSGSKLAKVMEALGELDYAPNEIAWASREPDPEEIPAWDPAQAIVAHERRVHACPGVVDKVNKKISVAGSEADVQMLDVSEPVTGQVIEQRKDAAGVAKDPASEHSANEPRGKFADSVDEVHVHQLPIDIPVESPFHPSHYPPPWPLVPFESPCPPFTLHRRIPIHLLPKKLYVHDPWKLVRARFAYCKEEEESWSSKTDHIHTYTLSPPKLKNRVEAAAKTAGTAEDETLKTPKAVFKPPQETEGPTEQPGICAFLPKRPRRPMEVPEAHLYLSPKGRLGTGHHSIVHEAELELPRDLFCESTYCTSCLDEQIQVEVDRLKESGEWEQRLNEAAETYEGPGKHDVASHHSPSSSIQIPPRYVGFVKHVPMETVDMVAATTLGETPSADDVSEQSARVFDSVNDRYIEYQGLIVPIHPNIQWQNPSFPDTSCEHQAKKNKPVPRTARFRVAAKLSFPGDPHLRREASNYLKFPRHFFQHWNGYNIVPPLHDPTPVGALVPQFFGYYTPDTQSDPNERDEYCSPILLIEHCGKEININKLTIDDRHECAAMLFRFHAAGWLHESLAERNILMQEQHPTCSPLEEKDQCDVPHQHRRYSFRLIDFGRSVKCEDPSTDCLVEQRLGKRLFRIP